MIVLASHSRKARREGVCPLCRGLISIGERIVRVGRGGSWVHRGCFTTRYRQTAGCYEGAPGADTTEKGETHDPYA